MFCPTGAAANVGTSSAYEIPNLGPNVRAVRVVAVGLTYIAFGTSSVSGSGGMRLPAGIPEIFLVPAGATHIATDLDQVNVTPGYAL